MIHTDPEPFGMHANHRLIAKVNCYSVKYSFTATLHS